MVAFSTLLYSVYEDYNGALGAVTPSSRAVASKVTVSGASATLQLNVTVPNAGLYPIGVSLYCARSLPAGTSCTGASVTVPPGGNRTLVVSLTAPLDGGSAPDLTGVKGNLTISLIPFASMTIGMDLGSLVGGRE